MREIDYGKVNWNNVILEQKTLDNLSQEERDRRHLDKWMIDEAIAAEEGKRLYGTKRMKQYLLNDRHITATEWRQGILENNDFTCMECGFYDWTGKLLHAHHIYPVSKYKELSKDYGNGITLCISCHLSIKGQEEELIEYFLSKVNYGPVTNKELDHIANWMTIG